MDLKDTIRSIKDFPEEGIIFRDITTLLKDPKALKLAVDTIEEKLDGVDYDVIVAPESRGFIFGMPLAYNKGKGFVPIRKKGKLPAETVSREYALEYGTATIEMHLGFYNNSQLKITSTEHIIYALTADRLYFKSADSTIGLKLCQKNKNSAARVKINRRFDKWVGEYNLLFDNKEGCWYIDLNKKLR